MENIKVSVKHNVWSEVFDMLVELGAKHKAVKSEYVKNNGWLFVHKDTIWVGLFPHERKECREVTFSELKDMVVLKRNDVSDANYVYGDYKVLKLDSMNYKIWNVESKTWVSHVGSQAYLRRGLKPIEKKEMKEFLVKNDFVESIWERNESENMKEFLVNHDDKWTLRLLDSDTQENNYRVAVPEGAEVLKVFLGCESGFCFYKENYTKIWQDFVEKPFWGTIYDNTTAKIAGEILWQRSESEPLNDQYVETIKATIDGVEAFNAIANDIDVQYRFAGGEWKDYTQDLNHEGSKLKAVTFLCDHCEFRYKPKTIVVNGVEYEDEQKAVKVVQDYFKGYIK